jgi:hypothetical protein
MYAFDEVINVCTQSGPRALKEQSQILGGRISFFRSWTLSVLPFVFVYDTFFARFVLYLVWSTYHAGITDNTSGIHQSVSIHFLLSMWRLSHCKI